VADESPPTPPLDADRVLREFSGEVPVFPLPSLVLLPDTIAPLLIFEDRYRRMIADALEGEKLVAMALLKPGWETQYAGNPPFFETVCVGNIVTHEKLADGRYRLLLYGLFRAAVEEETQTAPYRKIRVRPLPDRIEGAEPRAVAERVRETLDRLPGRRGRVGRIRTIAQQIRGTADAGPGRIADAAAEAAELEPDERYRILAEPDVVRRLEVLAGILDARGRTGHPELPPRTDPTLN
jgi:Lon protease-like protein